MSHIDVPKPFTALVGCLLVGWWLLLSATVSAKEVSPIERRDRFFGAATVNDALIWLAGSNGKILRLDLRNRPTWSIQRSAVSVHLQGIAAWDAKRAVAVGNDGTVTVTADGGASWSDLRASMQAVAGKLMAVRALAAGIGFAVGESNAVLRTGDFGRTWQRLTSEEDRAWFGIDATAGKILVTGEFGRILRSADSGRTWSLVQTPLKANLMAVASRDESRAVAVGLNGAVLKTDDGARNWVPVPTEIDDHLYDVLWDGVRYLACGERGLLLESNDGAQWRPLALTGIPQGRTWFMQIRKFRSGYLLAGSRVGLLNGGRYEELTGASNDMDKPIRSD